MQILVTCPHCQSSYQLDPSMRGKRMRCPNSICRATFEVDVPEEKNGAPPAAPMDCLAKPPTPLQQSGIVGELVPVLPATAEETPPTPHPLETLKVEPDRKPSSAPWALEAASAPVFVPGDIDFPGDVPVAGAPPPQIVAGPRELGPGKWELPPLRGEATIRAGPRAVAVEAAAASSVGAVKPKRPSKAGRGALLLVLLITVVLGGLAGGAYLLIRSGQETQETDRFQKAMELYDSRDFAESALAFRQLLADYPASPNRALYDLLRELSSVREPVYRMNDNDGHDSVGEAAKSLENVLQFLGFYKNDPLLKDRHGDIWQTLKKLTEALSNLAEEKQDPELLVLARASWEHARKFQPPVGIRVDEIEQRFARIAGSIGARNRRLEALGDLKGMLGRPSAAAVREARGLASKSGLDNDPEAKAILKELVAAHRASVIFVPAPTQEMRPRFAEDDVPSLYVAPALGKSSASAKEAGIVLAQAHGMLYALETSRGEIRWVRRVGVDSATLPLRVPVSSIMPERFLILSTDSKSMTAVVAQTGQVLWRTSLSDVCLGLPVLVDHHVLVPTQAGRIEEIEITEGRRQGHYQVGQSLPVGGVRQPGTSLVYFPADAFTVYVLDVARRECAAVLYTGHAPGSVRNLPAIWSEPKATGQANGSPGGWMLLALARSSAAEDFVPYSLPITDADQKPAEPSLRSKGTAWFAPWQDGDKLAWATDAGNLAIYGIRQKGNRDPLLFPLFKEDYLVSSQSEPSRAQVAHVDPENYWVLAHGRLHRLQAVFTAQAGPGLVARWPQPPLLGAPLYPSQARTDSDGSTNLYVITQAPGKSTGVVSAVDSASGHVLWQRHLGLICQGPLTVAGDLVACPDPAGMMLFDARKHDKAAAWQPGGVLAAPDIQEVSQRTLAHYKGILRLSWTRAASPELWLERWDERGESVGKLPFILPAPGHGTPAVGKDFVLLPLANGVVARLPLAKGNLANGPDWRGVAAQENSPCHIVALGNDDFVMTDGSRGLVRFHWGEGKLWDKKASAEASHRIVAPPAVLEGGRIAIADASDTVTLLDGERLQPVRRWSMPGKITAGPFARGGAIGCVVGNDRLFWLDPSKDVPAWEQPFVAAIVGEPALIDGFLIVADLAGRVQALDPKTGEALGAGYTIKANAPPAAAPTPFGSGRLFVPLLDGSIMLLPIERLKS